MDIVQKELSDSELLGIPARYDPTSDTVEVNDGTGWVNGDEYDPRLHDQFPPLTGAAARCDAAARMTAALDEVTNAIADALAGGAVTADLGTIIIAWLAVFAGFGILLLLVLALAAAIYSIGSANISTAYNTMPWTDIKCALYCRINADGRLTEATYQQFLAWVTENLTADQQTLINGALQIAGMGGLNAFAATRSETGDCSGCSACTWTEVIYPDTNADWFWGWQNLVRCSDLLAIYGVGGEGQLLANGAHDMWAEYVGSGGSRITEVGLHKQIPADSVVQTITFNYTLYNAPNGDTFTENVKCNEYWNCHTGAFGFANSITGMSISGKMLDAYFVAKSSNNSYAARVTSITLTGTGINPFLQG